MKSGLFEGFAAPDWISSNQGTGFEAFRPKSPIPVGKILHRPLCRFFLPVDWKKSEEIQRRDEPASLWKAGTLKTALPWIDGNIGYQGHEISPAKATASSMHTHGGPS
ncbi:MULTISPECIES: hypothetical protein [Cohnella]|uniref:hypothetical protein n=1 Tax=Cohnella TaxID=329857 RepID=UPI00111A5966|nr:MULTISPECIES: hypothetical protein [Cohnella]MBN2983530.1 hypothetical protein [Cohnella algarum]